MTLEFQHISGWVPKGFAPPGLLPNFTNTTPKKEDLKQARIEPIISRHLLLCAKLLRYRAGS